MNGKLNQNLSAGKSTQTFQENAAFAKIRNLSNEVAQLETDLNNTEQKVQENTTALANLSENVTTKNVDTTELRADTINAANVTSNNINSMNIDTNTITADKVNANNIEVAHSVFADTVDVEKSIANVGQFVETHTTTANNTTTNSGTLNVATETNLTGQVNIYGDMTFTKDTGLSKLQGQYLEIDAANVVITNDKKDMLALYVPGENGAAVFGGSVTVQDTVAAKNLIITGEAHIKDLNIEGFVLDNPTIENIKGTDELTTTALVLDNNGKLVVKKIANETAGSVANALVAKKENKTYNLASEWVADGNVHKVPVSSTAQFVYYANTNEYYLTNKNGNSLKLDNFTSFSQMIGAISHKNFVYNIYLSENNSKVEVETINSNTMEIVGSRFDITQYISGSIPSSVADVTDLLNNKMVWQPVMSGAVLNDDIPTIGFIGTNNYLDLSDMVVKTKEGAAFNNANTYILTKSNNWLELTGNINSDTNYFTNGKYSSVEDAVIVNRIGCVDVNDTAQLFYADAPVYGYSTGSQAKLLYIDGGVLKETPLADIGWKGGSGFFGTIDTDDNIVGFYPDSIITPGAITSCNIYTYGYFTREYFSVTISYTDVITIDKNKVEVYGKIFNDGEFYDAIVENVTELLEYIAKQKDSKRYKVLYTGKKDLEFDTSNTDQFPLDNIFGTFDIYNGNSVTLRLGGTPGTSTKIKPLMNVCYWHGFNTEISLILCRESIDWLHINDCTLSFNTVNVVPTNKYYLGISESNNVEYNTVNIPRSAFLAEESTNNKLVDVSLLKCRKVLFRGKMNTDAYKYKDISFDRSCCCEVNITTVDDVTVKQYGPGANLVYNTNSSSVVQPTIHPIM